MTGDGDDARVLPAAVVRAHVGSAGAAAGLPTEPLDDRSWRGLLRSADRERVTGLLGALIGDGSFPVTDAQHAEMIDVLERWAGHVVAVEELAWRAVNALEEAGVDARIAKGVALAHTVYAAPEHRVFADVDLFVPSEQIDTAVEIVTQRLEGRRVLPELRPGFDREFAKEVLLTVPGRYEVDLHRTLVPGPFGLRVPLTELFGSRPTFSLGGRDVATFSPVHQTVYAAMSVALADLPVRYSTLADLVSLVDGAAVDPNEVVAVARRWGQDVVLARAVDLVVGHLGIWDDHELTDLARSLRPGRLDRALLASNLAPGRTYLRQLAAVAVLPGMGARVRYIRALTAPSAEYLEARGWRRGAHLRRSARRLRGRRA